MNSKYLAACLLMVASPASSRQSSSPSTQSIFDHPKNQVQEWALACRKASAVPPVGDKFQCWGPPAQKLVDWLKTLEPPIMVEGLPFYALGHQGVCYLWKNPQKPDDPALASCSFGLKILPDKPVRPKVK